MKNIAFTINGKKISSPPGTTILAAAEKNAIYIPTLCNHVHLAPYGACRICIVEDENTGRLMASCVTPAAQDMAINTDSPRVTGHRKNIIRLMIAEHPESCIVCNKGNRCELRAVAAQLGVAETRLYPMPNYKPFETVNPFIVRDLSKCILCGKCIRADHELVCVGAIDYNDRGFASRPATLHGQPLELSRCTFCGTCVSMCPTGALSTGASLFTGTPEKEEETVCGFCGAGCSLSIGVSGNRVVEVNPSSEKDTANGATLCVKGHFAHDFLLSPKRLTKPFVKTTDENGNFTMAPAGFDEALSTVAGKLADIKRRHGPESIGFIGSTKCTNEENYLFQKIARIVFGTNNVTSCGTMNGHALLRKLEEKTSKTPCIKPLSGLENAEAIISILSDPDQTVPVAGYHIKRAVKKGVPLIVIDPFRSNLAAFGGTWLAPEGGTGGDTVGGNGARIHAFEIINALAAEIADKNPNTRNFIDNSTFGAEKWLKQISSAGADTLADKASILPEKIKKAASLLKGKKIAFVLPCDLMEKHHGKEILDAAWNLALITGSMGAENNGFYIFSLENNLAGAIDMGCAPDMLPGWRKIKNAHETQEIEALWGAGLPESRGIDIHEMIEAAANGTLKALYIMGENLLRALPDPGRVTAALKKLDFIVVQDILDNETAGFAHVLLPAAAPAEKQGSFTNMEGRIQCFGPVVFPPGEALADWSILARLARKAGHPEHYTTIEKIRQEIRHVVPMYAALGSTRKEWIKKTESKNAAKFAFSAMPVPDAADTDKHYPLTAFIGNLRWHLGSGTRTGESARINASGKTGCIEISSKDAKALGINGAGQPEENHEKNMIRLLSPFGAIERTVTVNPGVPEGFVFVPQGFFGNDVMRIADFNALKPGGPGWRSVSVRIETI